MSRSVMIIRTQLVTLFLSILSMTCAGADTLPTSVTAAFDRETTYVGGRAVNISVSALNTDGTVATGAESSTILLRVIVRSQIGVIDGTDITSAGWLDGSAVLGGSNSQEGIYALKTHAKGSTLVQSILNSNDYTQAGPGTDQSANLPSEAVLPVVNGIAACSVVYPSTSGIDTLTLTLQMIQISGQVRTLTTIDQENYTIQVGSKGGMPQALSLTSISTPATETNAGALVLAYDHFGGEHTAQTTALAWDVVTSTGAGKTETELPLDRTVLTAGTGGHVITIASVGDTFSGPVTLTLTPASNPWVRYAAPLAATTTTEGTVDPTGSAWFNNDPSSATAITITTTMTNGSATVTLPTTGSPLQAGRWYMSASAVRTDGTTVTSPARRDYLTVFPAQPEALALAIDRTSFARVNYSGRATIHPGTPRLILSIVDAYGNLADPARITYAGNELECIITWLGAATGSAGYAIPAGLNRVVLPIREDFSTATAGSNALFSASVAPSESITYTASPQVAARVTALSLCGEILGPNTTAATRYSHHTQGKTDGNPDPNVMKIGIDSIGDNGHPDNWLAYGTVGTTTIYPITQSWTGTYATTDANLPQQNVNLKIYDADHTLLDTVTVEAGAYQETDAEIAAAGVCSVSWRHPFTGDAYAIIEDLNSAYGSFLLPLNDTGAEMTLRADYGYDTSAFQGSMGATQGIEVSVEQGVPDALILRDRAGNAMTDADGNLKADTSIFSGENEKYAAVLELGHFSGGVGTPNSSALSLGGGGDNTVTAREEYLAVTDAMGNLLEGETAVGRVTVTSTLGASISYDSGSAFIDSVADGLFDNTGDHAWMVPGFASSHAVQISWLPEFVGQTETLTFQSNRAELSGKTITVRFPVPDVRNTLHHIDTHLSTSSLRAGSEAVLEISGMTADGRAVDTTVEGGHPLYLSEPPSGLSLYLNTRGAYDDMPLAAGTWVGADLTANEGTRLLTIRAMGTPGIYTITIANKDNSIVTSVPITITGDSTSTDPGTPGSGDTGATQTLLCPFYSTDSMTSMMGLCNTGTEQARLVLEATDGTQSGEFYLAGGEGTLVDLSARGLSGTGGVRVLYRGENAVPSIVGEAWTYAGSLVLRVPVMKPRTTDVFGSMYMLGNGYDTYIAVMNQASTEETGVIRFGSVPQYITIRPGEMVLRRASQLGATPGSGAFSIEGFSSYAAAAWIVPDSGAFAAVVSLETATALYMRAPLYLADNQMTTLVSIGSAGDQSSMVTVNDALLPETLMPRTAELLNIRQVSAASSGTIAITSSYPAVANTWIMIGSRLLWLPTRAPQPGSTGCLWKVDENGTINTFFICHNAGTSVASPSITLRGTGGGTTVIGSLGIDEVRVIDMHAAGITGEGTWTVANGVGVTVQACVMTQDGIWSVCAQ